MSVTWDGSMVSIDYLPVKQITEKHTKRRKIKMNETPRQKQMRFRKNLKETVGITAMLCIPYLMILHWIIVGY